MEQEINDGIKVIIADASHEKYVDEILQTISDAANSALNVLTVIINRSFLSRQ